MPKKSKVKRSRALKATKMNQVLKSRKEIPQGNDTEVQVQSSTASVPQPPPEPRRTAVGAVEMQEVCPEVEEDADNIHLQVDSMESAKQPVIEGRRIINLQHFYKKLQEISMHGPLNCGLGCVEIVSEKKSGLHSVFTLQCGLCNMKFYLSNDEESDMNINNSAVLGTVAIGCGYSQLQELSATLDLPLMGLPLYQKCHGSITEMWNAISLRTMKEAGKEERDAAISEGRTDENGIPMIDVIVDGCWSKRSYKKNYSALSGAAAIIGKKTGKILYIGIKNKYCSICAQAAYKNEAPRGHKCFKNYTGPSTGMETSILVEGFKSSLDMHGLIYERMISDGDSATYSKIIESRPYTNTTVQKIECKNHIMRNLCNKLSQLKTDTRYPMRLRKNITNEKIIAIRSTIKKAIEKYTSESESDKRAHVELLYDDILRAHIHAFGDHSCCKAYFCKNRDTKNALDHDFKTSSLWSKICHIMSNVASHAPSLIHNVESNKAENYNSIIAKLVGGKRVNFSLRGAYQNRCKGAAISYNTRALLSTTYKYATGQSPKGQMKRLEQKRLLKSKTKQVRKKLKNIFYQGEDTNYGENCTREDINTEMMEKAKSTFLNNLKKTKEEREYIERETILQASCSEWLELRRKLLTASNFGRVIKRRPNISCRNLVRDLLYKDSISHVKSIKHGTQNEKIAIEQICKETGLKIQPCGLFLDDTLPYLGASPDGVCNDMIVEIKCPISAYKLDFIEAVKRKKIPFYKINKNETVEINKKHNWYFQIQGQLHITKKPKCLLGIWLGENIPVRLETIDKDDKFWNEVMEIKLTRFYLDCILPELIDPRYPRKMEIRDPSYIQNAIEKESSLKKCAKKRKHNEKEENDVKDKENKERENEFVTKKKKVSEKKEIENDKGKGEEKESEFIPQNVPQMTIHEHGEISEDEDLQPIVKRNVLYERNLNIISAPQITIHEHGEISEDEDLQPIVKRKVLYERNLNIISAPQITIREHGEISEDEEVQPVVKRKVLYERNLDISEF